MGAQGRRTCPGFTGSSFWLAGAGRAPRPRLPAPEPGGAPGTGSPGRRRPRRVSPSPLALLRVSGGLAHRRVSDEVRRLLILHRLTPVAARSPAPPGPQAGLSHSRPPPARDPRPRRRSDPGGRRRPRAHTRPRLPPRRGPPGRRPDARLRAPPRPAAPAPSRRPPRAAPAPGPPRPSPSAPVPSGLAPPPQPGADDGTHSHTDSCTTTRPGVHTRRATPRGLPVRRPGPGALGVRGRTSRARRRTQRSGRAGRECHPGRQGESEDQTPLEAENGGSTDPIPRGSR